MSRPAWLQGRWEPRTHITWTHQAAVLAGSLAAGLLAIAAIFGLAGVNPLFAFGRIFGGSFASLYGWTETLAKAVPLMLIGVGLTVPFTAKFWNIGAESQLLAGAVAAGWLSLALGDALPAWLYIPVLMLTAMAAGALWGLIPAVLKFRFGLNEVISTLMLNYIAAEAVQWLVVGPLRGATQFGFPYSDPLPAEAWLPLIGATRIPWPTLVLALLICVALALVLARSRWGYEVRVLGDNREAARYAGIDFMAVALGMMALSGALAGLAGYSEIGAIHRKLASPQTMSAGLGFTGIIVAWLARLHPLMIPFSALFFAGILVGGDAIQISLRLPAATVHVFNGLLLLGLMAGDWFLHNRWVPQQEAR